MIQAELQEELQKFSLKISGFIPPWLEGSLIRNGPIYVTIDGKQIYHWFDGLAMLHLFSFQKGEVVYTNKFLRTEAYEAVFKKGSLQYPGFAVDPCRSIFKKIFTWFKPEVTPLHNANINVAKIADEYVAFTEIPLPVTFDPETLNTLGVLDFQDTLPKEDAWESAHPHQEEGETINYLIEFGRKTYYVIYKIKKGTTTREVIGKVEVEKPAYMHSFSKTENYVILVEYPFVVNPFNLMVMKKPFIMNYNWESVRRTTFLVISRETGKVVKTYACDPFFAFHHANAFEEKGKIILDICCYKDASIVMGMKDHFRPEPPFIDEDIFQTELRRFILGENLETVSLFNKLADFPRIHPHLDGLTYRYLYLANGQDDHSGGNIRELYKFDTFTKEALVWSSPDCYPGEPVFVPKPNSPDEDEGVILSLVIDKKDASCFLLILEGKTFKELGRARSPHLIPAGLHGHYFR